MNSLQEIFHASKELWRSVNSLLNLARGRSEAPAQQSCCSLAIAGFEQALFWFLLFPYLPSAQK